MKTSTEIYSIANKVGYEKAVEYVGKAGFDAWDFSMFDMYKGFKGDYPLLTDNYLQYAQKLKAIGLDNGITCNQSHAPFPSHDVNVNCYLKRAIECTAEAGGNICIIHPVNHWSVEENKELYESLLPFAKDYGVKIAAENMWNWNDEKDEASFASCSNPESFCATVDSCNSDYLVACLDIGHAEMKGLGTSAVELIKALGPRLQALHIHDNDRWHDSHQIPFSMNIDFEAIVKALKEINYKGFFTLEADQYMNTYNGDDYFKGVKDLASVARRLADSFDNL